MRIKTILIILLFTSGISFSQSLTNSVIGSIGGHQENSSFGTIHWTIGEMSIESIGKHQGHHQLFQGFHQIYPELLIINSSIIVEDISIEVFPNPTSGQLSFHFESIENIHVTIANQIGQQMKTFIPDYTNYQIDLYAYQDGLYFISIFNKSELIQSFKIIKS